MSMCSLHFQLQLSGKIEAGRRQTLIKALLAKCQVKENQFYIFALTREDNIF